MTNHVNDDENNLYYILNSQSKNQKLLSNIDANFNYTIDENKNRENNALNILRRKIKIFASKI